MAASMLLLLKLSLLFLQVTPMYPYFKGYVLLLIISMISSGFSTKSSFDITPKVLVKYGSTSLAIFKESEFAISIFAGESANIIALGFDIKSSTIFLTTLSILSG